MNSCGTRTALPRRSKSLLRAAVRTIVVVSSDNATMNVRRRRVRTWTSRTKKRFSVLIKPRLVLFRPRYAIAPLLRKCDTYTEFILVHHSTKMTRIQCTSTTSRQKQTKKSSASITRKKNSKHKWSIRRSQTIVEKSEYDWGPTLTWTLLTSLNETSRYR